MLQSGLLAALWEVLFCAAQSSGSMTHQYHGLTLDDDFCTGQDNLFQQCHLGLIQGRAEAITYADFEKHRARHSKRKHASHSSHASHTSHASHASHAETGIIAQGSKTSESTCTVWGDAHVSVFDHAESSWAGFFSWFLRRPSGDALFNTTEEGDFWLVKSDEVHIQGRYKVDASSNYSETRLKSIAVGGPFLQNNALVIGTAGKNILWNGEEVMELNDAEFQIANLVNASYLKATQLVQDGTQTSPGIIAEFALGVKLVVNRQRDGLGIAITMPPVAGGQDGQCGNCNGDRSDDSAQLIAGRLGLQVQKKERIFRTPFRATVPRPARLLSRPHRQAKPVIVDDEHERERGYALALMDPRERVGGYALGGKLAGNILDAKISFLASQRHNNVLLQEDVAAQQAAQQDFAQDQNQEQNATEQQLENDQSEQQQTSEEEEAGQQQLENDQAEQRQKSEEEEVGQQQQKVEHQQFEQAYHRQVGEDQQVAQQETDQQQQGRKMQQDHDHQVQQQQQAQVVGPKGSLGEGMAGYATLNWDNAVVKHNNLCGSGPDGDAPTLVFGGLVQGAPYDLDVVIECGENSRYKASGSSLNGKHGKYGAIFLAGKDVLDLKMTFVDPQTQEPVVLKKFYLSKVDLVGADRHPFNENLIVYNAFDFAVPKSSHLGLSEANRRMFGQDMTGLKFTSPRLHIQSNHPSDPMVLTPEQKDRSVSFLFLDTPVVYFTLEAKAKDRLFLLSGESALAAPPPMCVPPSGSEDALAVIQCGEEKYVRQTSSCDINTKTISAAQSAVPTCLDCAKLCSDEEGCIGFDSDCESCYLKRACTYNPGGPGQCTGMCTYIKES